MNTPTTHAEIAAALEAHRSANHAVIAEVEAIMHDMSVLMRDLRRREREIAVLRVNAHFASVPSVPSVPSTTTK